MAAITICSDFGAPKNSLTLFPLFLHLFPMKWWDWMPWSSFSECWVLSQLFHSPFSLASRGFLVLLHFSAIRVVSSAYLRLLIFLPAILLPAFISSSPDFGCSIKCLEGCLTRMGSKVSCFCFYCYYVFWHTAFLSNASNTIMKIKTPMNLKS